MGVIVYRRHSFKEPAPIAIDQFSYLRRQIAGNAGFEINGDFKTTFTSQYKKAVRWFLIGGASCIGAILLYRAFFDFIPGHFGWPEILAGIPIIAGSIASIFTIVRILLEGPSMATFLTERKLYFIRMKHAIRHYADYPAFYTSFYGDGKKNIGSSNAPFRQEAWQELQQGPPSMDRFLTQAFYWIDQHFWKLILAAFAIVLIKKYIIK